MSEDTNQGGEPSSVEQPTTIAVGAAQAEVPLNPPTVSDDKESIRDLYVHIVTFLEQEGLKLKADAEGMATTLHQFVTHLEDAAIHAWDHLRGDEVKEEEADGDQSNNQ